MPVREKRPRRADSPRGPPKPPSATPWRLNNADYRTCSTVRLPAGGGRSSSDSGRVSSSQASHSDRLRTTICRSWMGATSGPGPGRQERKSVPCAVGHRAPEARKAEPVLARLGEFPLRFGRFRAGELEEMRRWDEAAPFRKPSPLGAKIDDRPSLRPRRRNAPTQLNKLDPVLAPPKDRRGFGRPDIVARFEIGGRDREYDGDADLAESFQIGAVGDVVAEIVAHRQTCRLLSNTRSTENVTCVAQCPGPSTGGSPIVLAMFEHAALRLAARVVRCCASARH